MAGPGGEHGERALHGAVQRLAAREAVHDEDERARREVAGGVAVALCGALDGQLEDELRLPADEQPERRGAHHRAAPLGVGVLRRVQGAHRAVGEAGQAGPAGGALRVQPLLAGEPAVVVVALVGSPVVLGGVPAAVGRVHVGGWVPGAGVASDLGADQPVHGEQRHLGVVGDAAAPAVGRDEVRDAVGPVRLADGGQRVELDAGAQGVADRAAEQTTADPTTEVVLLGAAPHHGRRTGRCGHDLAPFSSFLWLFAQHPNWFSTVMDHE